MCDQRDDAPAAPHKARQRDNLEQLVHKALSMIIGEFLAVIYLRRSSWLGSADCEDSTNALFHMMSGICIVRFSSVLDGTERRY